MYIGLLVKYPLFLSDFNETKFHDRFWENIQISDFMKIRPVGAVLFFADRRTDGYVEANSRFSHFFQKRPLTLTIHLGGLIC